MKKIIFGLLLGASSIAMCETLFKDQSLSVLQGSDYEVGDNERVVLTYEYLSIHSWGDVFGFVDRLVDQNKGGAATYIELSPNFNIVTFKQGWVKSIKLASTWEMNEEDDQLLLGLGLGFNVPGFSNLSVSAYQRFNDSGRDNQQVTTVWGLPFGMANQSFLFSGFWDYATTLKGTSSSNVTSQLKWDAAKVVGYDNRLYLGVEYVLWNDKFHIKGVNENNVNLLLKMHF